MARSGKYEAGLFGRTLFIAAQAWLVTGALVLALLAATTLGAVERASAEEIAIVNEAEVNMTTFGSEVSPNRSPEDLTSQTRAAVPALLDQTQIPQTGSDAASGLLLGFAMVLIGGFASIIAYRRARNPKTND